MFITILDGWGDYPKESKSQVFLTWDKWNDYSYRTLFGIFYVDGNSKKHDLKGIKIGHYGQKEGNPKLEVGNTFETLPEEYFSLAHESYYDELNKLGPFIRDKILKALNDIAKYPAIYEKAIYEKVTEVSLLRGITLTEVTGQLRRMATGGSRLTPYQFTYKNHKWAGKESNICLSFNVVPESNPPTNINVLIGKNGSGKTTLINNMIKSLLYPNSEFKNGEFDSDSDLFFENNNIFPNLISISFSAFDESGLENSSSLENADISYKYIGLKKGDETKPDSIIIKTPFELKDEFLESLTKCKNDLKKERWQKAVSFLESDSNFKNKNILSLILVDDKIKDEVEREIAFKTKASNTFGILSSGHKIVLLTITRLVESLEEKSLVLIDEPETHLHPPLLSAFTRALSQLLIDRNGVAIIATHSPVILQEVPSSCVWKLRLSGSEPVAERLAIESFGENVGILTSEVFRLEVTNSGFYELLKDAVKNCNNYEEGLDYFNDQLGMEARSILMSLFVDKNGF